MENIEEQNTTQKPLISLEKLIEFEVHWGLKTSQWNPKMKDFIWKKNKNRHIIEIRKSILFLEKSCNYIADLVSAGLDIMFVGVKNKDTNEIIKKAAQRVNAFYVTQRWLGGLLTNFHQISKTIRKLNEIDELLSNKELSDKYTKKELLMFSKKKVKLEKFYSGIRNLNKLPNLIIVFNPVDDITAVKEARKIGIPIVALSNTNTDPDLIDFIIPGNNITKKSVYLISNILCDAIALANGQDTLISYRDDDEIICPEELVVHKTKNFNERGNNTLV